LGNDLCLHPGLWGRQSGADRSRAAPLSYFRRSAADAPREAMSAQVVYGRLAAPFA